MRRGFAHSSLGQLHYREQGAGAPLVLLHELPGSGGRFAPLMAMFGDSRRCIALDLPGYGESDTPAAYPGITGYARAVVDAANALGLARLDLLGFHTGAGVALEVAAAYPERVRRLVLCGLPEVAEGEEDSKIASLRPTAVGPDGAYFDTLKARIRAVQEHWPPDFAREYAIDYLRAIPNDHWGHRAVFEMRVRDRIPAVRAPTLLFCSRDDAFVAFQPGLAARFADAEAHVIHESAKFPLVNQPARSHALIDSFLARR